MKKEGKIIRMSREKFLRKRKQAIEWARNHPGPGEILMDPEDEIVCDFTNQEIETPYVNLYVSSTGESEWALCDEKLTELLQEGYRLEMDDSMPYEQVVS